MSPLFQRSGTEKDQVSKRAAFSASRVSRYSSGWIKILARLKTAPGLRVLDIGPTSPSNINLLTSLGHSVYMADLVEEAVKPDWLLEGDSDDVPRYNTEDFLARHMDFRDRKFDIILLWDALDYIPAPLSEAILDKFRSVLAEQGQVLAFFHSKAAGPETAFCRYHVQDGEMIQTQEGVPHPVLRTYQNRQVENLFQQLGTCRFLLAKDNTREVIVSCS